MGYQGYRAALAAMGRVAKITAMLRLARMATQIQFWRRLKTRFAMGRCLYILGRALSTRRGWTWIGRDVSSGPIAVRLF